MFSTLKLFVDREGSFLLLMSAAFLTAFFAQPYAGLAMWVGFFFAAYAAIANDSIQTIGTFIASNQDKKFWVLWLFLGGIFVGTACWSFFTSDSANNELLSELTTASAHGEIEHQPDGIADGDVSHGRLLAKGFDRSPASFHFLQISAPIILLLLTRMRMPVSTTFILLTSFAADPAAVGSVLAKSFSGYILAFVLAIVCFAALARLTKKLFVGEAHFGWTIAQWLTSGTLWSIWLMQDMANIAVFLPRSLTLVQFVGFTSMIFLGMGVLLYLKGGRIQSIVLEKSKVTDVRFATLIDFIYAILLFYFKLHSKVPMSTTWVFLGLLAGRELAMSLTNSGKNSLIKSILISIRDFCFALIGLMVSIAIAIAVNDQLNLAVMIEKLPSEFSAGIAKFFTRLLGG
jgi:hypothetical protein